MVIKPDLTEFGFPSRARICLSQVFLLPGDHARITCMFHPGKGQNVEAHIELEIHKSRAQKKRRALNINGMSTQTVHRIVEIGGVKVSLVRGHLRFLLLRPCWVHCCIVSASDLHCPKESGLKSFISPRVWSATMVFPKNALLF